MVSTANESDRRSIQDTGNLADGTMVTSALDGQAWLVESGQRRLVTNVAAAFAAGVTDPETLSLRTLTNEDLERIPVADGLVASLVGTRQVDTGEQFLGAGHYMRTSGSIASSGQIAMKTRTRTITLFGGYHGCVVLIAADSSGAPTYQSQKHRYGVDGTWVGRSDRTDAWWENMSADAASRTSQVAIFHAWDPDTFERILDRWASDAKKIADLIGSIGTVAKVFTSIF